MRNRYLVPLALAALLGVPVFAQAQVTKKPAAVSPQLAMRRRVFDLVWRTVQAGHYDPKMNGVNWKAVRAKYQPRAEKAPSETAFYGVLNDMLGELKQSHLGAIPPAALRAAKEATPGEVQGETGESGITVEWIEKLPVVARVEAESAGAAAGVKPGQVVVSIDGKPVLPVLEKLIAAHPSQHPGEERVTVWATMGSMLAGTVGKPYTLVVKDPDDTERTVTVTPLKSEAQMIQFGALPPLPGEIETKTLENGVGYIRFSIWMMQLSEPVKEAIRGFAAKKAPGLILDLRGNRGGLGVMASGIAGTLMAKQSNLGTMRTRESTLRFPIFPQQPVYTGPLAILTDEGSISTSEIMAAGLQELKRASVVGRPSAGMVLPSQIITLPDGGRLQFVFADFKTPKGTLLEGRGVLPDVPVTLTRASLFESKSGDPILDAALAKLTPKENAN